MTVLLTENRFVAPFIEETEINNFDEYSQDSLEELINVIDLFFEKNEFVKSGLTLIKAKKAAIAVRDQYESLGYSLPENLVTSYNGIRIFEGVNAA